MRKPLTNFFFSRQEGGDQPNKDLSRAYNEYVTSLGEDHAVVKVLKASCSQGIVSPFFVWIKLHLLEGFSFKDVAQGWVVQVFFQPTSVTIIHKKKQQGTETKGDDEFPTFSFQWNLKMVFDKEMQTLKYCAFSITDLEMFLEMDATKKKKLKKVLKPWQDNFQEANRIVEDDSSGEVIVSDDEEDEVEAPEKPGKSETPEISTPGLSFPIETQIQEPEGATPEKSPRKTSTTKRSDRKPVSVGNSQKIIETPELTEKLSTKKSDRRSVSIVGFQKIESTELFSGNKISLEKSEKSEKLEILSASSKKIDKTERKSKSFTSPIAYLEGKRETDQDGKIQKK